MTRKFVYDPQVQRVCMVAWTTGSHGALAAQRWRPLRWMVVALMVVASAMAFDAAHASAPATSQADAR